MQTQIAEEWDQIATLGEKSDPFNTRSRLFIDELLLQEIGDVKEKKVLDVGCGNGDFIYKLAEKGALAKGVDSSPKIIDLARKKYPELDFHVADLSQQEYGFSDNFDVIILELVAMFVKDVDAMFNNIKNLLKPGGQVYVVIVHPFLVLAAQSLEKELGFKFDNLDDYFIEQVLKLRTDEVDLTYFSRPVSWYVKKFVDLGFHLADIDEPNLLQDSNAETIRGGGRHEPVPFVMLFTLSLVKEKDEK